MTEKVNPSPFRPAEAFKTAGANYYDSANGNYIVDASNPTELSKQDTGIDDTALNAFAESHSSTSYDVTIDPGEAFVFGSWLAIDVSTTVTLPSSSTTTVYVGWDKSASDDVIIGPDDGQFATAGDDTDQKTALYDFTTDGSGVTGSSDLRQVGPPLPAGEDIPNSSLANSSVTVATNTVALGGSTAIDHIDLSAINSDDHHTKTSSASELTDVSADSVSDAHHSKYTDENAQDAIGYNLGTYLSYDDATPEFSLTSGSVTVAGNSVSLGGSTSVNHNDLSTISSDDHHTKTSSASELTDVSADSVSNAHHTKGSDAEDSGTVVVSNSTAFDFDANLSVTDDGDGTVTIDAASSTDTTTDVSENGATIINQTDDINFTDTGAATVGVTDDGDGTVTVNVDASDSNTTYSAGNALYLSGTQFNVSEGNINHDNLSGVSSGDHHSRYSDSEAISAINNDGDHGSTASHNYYTDSDAVSAINTDGDHGSTASHNYFSGSHNDLSDVTSGDHHSRYSDEEAQDAVGAMADSSLAYDDANDSLGVDESYAYTWGDNHNHNGHIDMVNTFISFNDNDNFLSSSIGFDDSVNETRWSTGDNIFWASADTTHMRFYTNGTTASADIDLRGTVTENASL